jgi:hypothetical protein
VTNEFGERPLRSAGEDPLVVRHGRNKVIRSRPVSGKHLRSGVGATRTEQAIGPAGVGRDERAGF